ncbi:ADP-ribosylglycohydrolase family protein [Chitinophaga defluvii]|uniref:ADP-ribosylglycohydrolase family protein n=1 Tax=Chitinophaga defluvii TaxID=3163343 RepID=A0ABV2SYZ4_9BACT
MKRAIYTLGLGIFLGLGLSMPAHAQQTLKKGKVSITKERLKDKIKGGWAGQTIGVTYGGPTEFQYCGVTIHDSIPIKWYDGYIKKTMIDVPGLYDDLYMDLAFVDVYHRLGLKAPVDSFAQAFAHAAFPLDQANQAARYNILAGMGAHEAGHWINNPHADDIDYQIESDFAGLMSPGMPNAASAISDKVGHIMNYGDGWYGGVYVGAMYTLAFLYDDVHLIVKEALKTVPVKSDFYKCIADVIQWHQEYPNDWRKTWSKLEEKWANDYCPDGVFREFDIDAKMNAAYVVLGLLYGNGDYGKTLEISTRAGQDSDCNPSTAGGILGTLLGYDHIPAYWKMGLQEAEDIDFKYTTLSLNKVYDISFQLALDMIRKYGGKVGENEVQIATQRPKPVKYEKSFPGMYPTDRVDLWRDVKDTASLRFKGTGFVWRGTTKAVKAGTPDHVFLVDVYIDGKKTETVKLPTNITTRRRDFCWKYQMPDTAHEVKIVVNNPNPDYELLSLSYVVYGTKPVAH